MGAVMGYGGALQVPWLEGFDSLGFHQICPHSIMDNTLVYETGDCGSIPYVGAKIEYRVSSVVEQRLDKALVASSNLASGTKNSWQLLKKVV